MENLVLKSFTRRRSSAFTLLEIMIVASIMAIVVAIAAPTWLRQREVSRSVSCQENLSKIDGAKEQYALDFKVQTGQTVDYPTDLLAPPGTAAGTKQGYLKSIPRCPNTGIYSVNPIGTHPECSIGSTVAPFAPHTLN